MANRNLGFMEVQDKSASAAQRQHAVDPVGSKRPGEGLARLRVLATSDLHAHLRGFDYARNVEVAEWGLTRVASCVSAARAEASASILLDNGDILQGTPLAELYSDPSRGDAHPVLRAMEVMGYDAIGLGNHEFDYGLERMQQVLGGTRIPVICANLLTQKGPDVQEDVPLLPPSVMIRRVLADPQTAEMAEISIGVLSVLPVQVMNWDGATLQGRAETRNMEEAARSHADHLRRAGADIVILLAHSGIDADATDMDAENAAVSLARVPGIDAVVAGHTHHVFPGGVWTGDGIDAARGRLHDVPAVMPGFRGSHLGVMDLYLSRARGRWQVEDSHASAIPVAGAPEDRDVMRVVEPAHQATLDYIHQPIGQTNRPIHSYLSQIRDDRPNRLVAMAQRALVAARLVGTPYEKLPILSASAPYMTGGRAGPLAYIDIPPGPLTMGEATSLYPFPNTLCAVRTTGAQVMDWLERAVSSFHQIRPGQGDQPLINTAFPGHAVDVLYGVTYRIDLTLPPAYDARGNRIADLGAPPRVVDLIYDDAPVKADDQFVVAVNGYRAYGGGPYLPVEAERMVLQTDPCALQCVTDFLSDGGVDRMSDDPTWSFLPVPCARGVFTTGPGLAGHEEDIAALGLVLGGVTEDGFLSVTAPLDHKPCESAA